MPFYWQRGRIDWSTVRIIVSLNRTICQVLCLLKMYSTSVFLRLEMHIDTLVVEMHCASSRPIGNSEVDLNSKYFLYDCKAFS